MGEGVLGAEIEGKHGRCVGAGEGSNRRGWGPERLRAEWRRGPESGGQTRRGDGGGGQLSCRLERGSNQDRGRTAGILAETGQDSRQRCGSLGQDSKGGGL